MSEMKKFKQAMSDIGFELTQQQLDQFMSYYEMLIQWNQSMNLTAITKFDDVMFKHFLDSAAFHLLPEYRNGVADESLIDVGTGAGFPGIPIKILCPQVRVTLVDSLNKRIHFLEELIKNLELENIEAIHARAEQIGHHEKHRERYTMCVSRAVANLATLSEYCLPLVKKEGLLIAYKASGAEEEIKEAEGAIRTLGGTIEEIHPITLHYGEQQLDRTLVKIRKTQNTPEKYPRKDGIPSKRPLK
jgi:16S rRNA (guanine527-N7)-methyltransferase